MWNLFAHKNKDRLWHVGEKRWVELHGLSNPIVPVKVTVIGEGQGPKECYYGWQDVGKYDKPPSMIWPHWVTFTICFLYGPQAEVERGKGRIVQLKIEEITNET